MEGPSCSELRELCPCRASLMRLCRCHGLTVRLRCQILSSFTCSICVKRPEYRFRSPSTYFKSTLNCAKAFVESVSLPGAQAALKCPGRQHGIPGQLLTKHVDFTDVFICPNSCRSLVSPRKNTHVLQSWDDREKAVQSEREGLTSGLLSSSSRSSTLCDDGGAIARENLQFEVATPPRI